MSKLPEEVVLNIQAFFIVWVVLKRIVSLWVTALQQLQRVVTVHWWHIPPPGDDFIEHLLHVSRSSKSWMLRGESCYFQQSRGEMLSESSCLPFPSLCFLTKCLVIIKEGTVPRKRPGWKSWCSSTHICFSSSGSDSQRGHVWRGSNHST